METHKRRLIRGILPTGVELPSTSFATFWLTHTIAPGLETNLPSSQEKGFGYL